MSPPRDAARPPHKAEGGTKVVGTTDTDDTSAVQVLPPPSAPMDVAKAMAEKRYRSGELLHWRGRFWSWVGPKWVELEDSAVRSIAYSFTEDAFYIDAKGAAAPWAPTRRKIADLIDALAATTYLPADTMQPSWMQTDPGSPHPDPAQIISCQNGLLSVSDRELGPHTPDYFNNVAVPFAHDPDAGEPTRWLEFLDQLWPNDPDSIAALQEFVGYVLAGRIDLHKMLLLVGPTRAGKGVIARVLKALVGEGNAAGPTLASLGTNFGLSPLIGKPLAIVSDARLGGGNAHQIVERLLSVSGEDMLTIDRKYREPWTGTLNARFVIISNELPRFGDASGAIANRMIVLALRTSFLGRENPRLTRELLGELPGILLWALDGLERLNRSGAFTVPASSADAVLSLQDLASPVAAFVRDECDVDDAHEIPVAELFDAWKEWCADNGRDRAGTTQTFARDLRAVVPSLSVARVRNGSERERRYRGIRLGQSQSHNAKDRGPSRTTTAGRGGPRSNPLCSQPDNGEVAS